MAAVRVQRAKLTTVASRVGFIMAVCLREGACVVRVEAFERG
jgi:hypothetical protein